MFKSLTDFALFVQERAAYAMTDDAEATPGDKQCQWCRASATCVARATYFLDKDFPAHPVDRMTPKELGEVYAEIAPLEKWIRDIKKEANRLATLGDLPGWKYVKGRSVRTVPDEPQVIEALKSAGLTDENLYDRKLIGITALEKLLGKKNEVLKQVTGRKTGSPTLVPESDPRPAYTPSLDAERDFSEFD